MFRSVISNYSYETLLKALEKSKQNTLDGIFLFLQYGVGCVKTPEVTAVSDGSSNN